MAVAYDTTSGPGGGQSFDVALFINNGHGFDAGKIIYTQAVPSGANLGFEGTTDLDLVQGDFDADGHADLALRTTASDPNNPAEPVTTLTVLYGNGQGDFTAKTVGTNSNLEQIAAADMNNDGTSDIVANHNPMLIYYGHPNRTFTRVSVAAANDQSGAPMVADFDGNGLKDIVYPAEDDQSSQNIGVSALLQTSPGKFQQQAFHGIDSYYGAAGAVPYTQTAVGDYNHDRRPDVTLFTSGNDTSHPESADVLLNLASRRDGTCNTPVVGVAICSPADNATVASPVQFGFSAASFDPVRKMEVWVDGVKKSETYEVFSNKGFADVTLSLPSGRHRIGFISGNFDGTFQRTVRYINVK